MSMAGSSDRSTFFFTGLISPACGTTTDRQYCSIRRAPHIASGKQKGPGICAWSLLGVPGYVTIPTWSPLLTCSVVSGGVRVKLNRRIRAAHRLRAQPGSLLGNVHGTLDLQLSLVLVRFLGLQLVGFVLCLLRMLALHLLLALALVLLAALVSHGVRPFLQERVPQQPTSPAACEQHITPTPPCHGATLPAQIYIVPLCIDMLC